MLQSRTLRGSLELVLELEPVDDVRLLPDAPAAEMAVAHPRRQLDRLGDLVNGELAQLPGLDQLVGGADLGLDQAHALDLDPHLVEFQGFARQRHGDPRRLAGTHLDALDGGRGVADELHGQRPLAEGHGDYDEASIRCG